MWVTTPGHPARLVWALWSGRGPLAGSLLVAVGGADQDVPGLVDGAAVTVTVAEPGTRTALGTVACTARGLLGDERATADGLLLAARRGDSRPGEGPRWTDVLALALLGDAPAAPGARAAAGPGPAPR